MLNKIKRMPFVHDVWEPSVSWRSDDSIYLGLGFYGSDGQKTVALGLDLLFFLGTAERIHQEFFNGAKKIIVSDLCFPFGFFNVENEIVLIKKILKTLSTNNGWEINKVSEVLEEAPEAKNAQSYEQMQALVALKSLEKKGYQIGWMYPENKNGAKDEKHFFKYLRTKYPEENEVGAIFTKFPVPPGCTSGPPYIVKPDQVDKRILLVDHPEAIKLKFKRGCPRGRIRSSFFADVASFIDYYEIPVERRDPVGMHIGLSQWIEERVGHEYGNVF